jgi:redox-sensing transcriptional repressor
VAAFDDDSRKWHRQIHGKVVLPLDKLPELARRMHVLIGVITVPAEAAQEVAQIMVDSGIRAIWNFAPVRLRVPPEVIVRNEDLYCSLASLSQRLAIALRAEQAADEPHPVSQR